MEVGLRKGKKKSIHLPIRISFEEDGSAKILGVINDKMLGIIERCHGLKSGKAWLTIVPPSGVGKSCLLKELNVDGRKLRVMFTDGPFGRIDILLDNRSRARNLEEGRRYSINILPWKKFFEMYERRSIPAGKGGRSEPSEVGMGRIKKFEGMVLSSNGRALDVATGLKGYLKKIGEKHILTCGNISSSMLKRTRSWLDNDKASFVSYDVESGLPFKKESFNLVICDALLEYVKDPKGVLVDISRLVVEKGELLLLEPIIPLSESEEFYPQDLWEFAIWRPLYQNTFNGMALEGVLQKEGFKVTARHTMNFEYSIYDSEKFQQDLVRFEKL